MRITLVVLKAVLISICYVFVFEIERHGLLSSAARGACRWDEFRAMMDEKEPRMLR